MRARAACIAALALCGGWACPALAQEAWAIGRNRAPGVDASASDTFRDLVGDEIRRRRSVRVVNVDLDCADVECVRGAATGTGARLALHTRLSPLGENIIASLSAAEVTSGDVVFTERMTAARIEELDTIAGRLAEALVSRQPVAATAELGTITHEEAAAPKRRRGRTAFGLHLEGVIPTRGYADRQLGGGFDLGLWLEALDFAIEPRFGFRSDFGSGRPDYLHVGLELAGYYIFSRTDVAPILGLGVGVHYLSEEVPVTRTVGTLLPSTSTDVIDDSVVGAGGFARVGLLLFRTYWVSMLATIDYGILLADFQERSDDQALRLHLGIIMGGT